MTDFVHLHVHTEYSLLDGACRIEKLISAAKQMGQKAIAVTDHGVMYGAVEVFKAAQKAGLKAVIGCEVYVAPRSRFDKVKEYDGEYRHLILLCKNAVGYKNLSALVSAGFTEGFYSKPRIDEELLSKHTEGLIALSACLSGEVPKALLRNDYEQAKAMAIRYNQMFGQGNYYLEIQNHGLNEEQLVMPQIIRISKETGIPIVATNDVHYVEKEDAKTQEILICIGTNHTLNDKNRLVFDTDEMYLKSGDQMAEIFPKEAIENTVKIADMCDFTFEFGNTKLPYYDIGNKDHFEYLKTLSYDGAKAIFGQNLSDEVTERLEFELGVINKMGYVDYFLIVSDFVRYAKSKNIPVGPGRGSGAASLVAFCIGITGIDPLKYNLLFERFLNPERVSMPDFDIDFCYVRRQEVIDYVISKYGSDHVAQIVTFGTMAARAAVRDVGRAMDIPYAVCDRIAKLIPQELKVTIDSALEKTPELKKEYESDPKIKELIDTARKVEGMPRHASTHAAGVVITDRPAIEYVPLATNDGAVVTQYTMTTLEKLGLLKMDFLGLRNLTVIDDAVNMIRKTDKDFSIDNIPLDDKATMQMMSMGKTEGVFQFESGGMRSVLQSFKPEKIEDLIAIISLYRPGPMDSIPKYIKNRHNPEQIKYDTELLRPILEVTYGCIVYQEQVMQVFRSLAGYSLGRADIVRRAMAKKKHDVMEKERSAFIYGDKNPDGMSTCDGCVNRGVTAEVANKIFDEMSAFSSYAFNKSHAAAYAFVAYQTAYLKCHYEKEFMSALLTSVLDNPAKLGRYIAECVRNKIKILPPDVNKSYQNFAATDEGIRFGLLAIRNIGGSLAELIISEREKGVFKSVYDFCDRLYGFDLNRRAAESLIKSGALDCFGNTRRQMLQGIEQLMRSVEADKKYSMNGQLDLFGGFEEHKTSQYQMPYAEEMPKEELLNGEKEVTGMFISGHPLNEYSLEINSCDSVKTYDLNDSEKNQKLDNKRVSVVGIVSKVRKKSTKTEQTMAFIELEDIYGSVNSIVFPKTYENYVNLLTLGSIVKLTGRVSISENGDPDIIAEKIELAIKDSERPSNNTTKKNVRHGLYLRVASTNSDEYDKAKQLILSNRGVVPVVVKVINTGEIINYKKDDFVIVDDALLQKLCDILGDDNVKYIE